MFQSLSTLDFFIPSLARIYEQIEIRTELSDAMFQIVVAEVFLTPLKIVNDPGEHWKS